MPRRPRLTYLRAFDASARNLSFSLAAKELNLTQAAVSQQIKKLEYALGAALFIRHNRSLTLSESGKDYYRTVRDILDRLDNETDLLFPDARNSIVSLYCTPSIATLWLAPRLRDFHTLHPEIEVHLRTADVMPNKYRARENHLEIMRSPQNADLTTNMQKLWDAQIFPVCSPEFEERWGPFSSPDHVCQQDLIHTMGYNNDWHRWAHIYTNPDTQVNSGFSVDGLVISVEAACRGEGLILGRSPLIDAFLQDGRLVRALPNNPGLTSAYYLKSETGGTKRKHIKIFADWILDQARNKTASGIFSPTRR